MNYWEIIADRLSASGWSWGMTAIHDINARKLFVLDAYKGDGRRFIVRADELLTAFRELEQATRANAAQLPPDSGSDARF